MSNPKHINDFCKELRALMEKHGIDSLGVEIEGDTHGISEQFVIDDNQNKTHVIDGFSSYLDKSDLRDYIEVTSELLKRDDVQFVINDLQDDGEESSAKLFEDYIIKAENNGLNIDQAFQGTIALREAMNIMGSYFDALNTNNLVFVNQINAIDSAMLHYKDSLK